MTIEEVHRRFNELHKALNELSEDAMRGHNPLPVVTSISMRIDVAHHDFQLACEEEADLFFSKENL